MVLYFPNGPTPFFCDSRPPQGTMAVSCVSSKRLDISEPPFSHLKAWLEPTFVESAADVVVVASTVYGARLYIRPL